MTTHTRVHTHITFANPWLTCDECGFQVTGWHNPQPCGCTLRDWSNRPCGHSAGVTSICPSWGPVDDCSCAGTHTHKGA